MAIADFRGGAIQVDYIDFGRGLSLSRQTVAGEQVLQIGGGNLALSASGTTSSEEGLRLTVEQASPADNDELYLSFFLDDDAGTATEYARLLAIASDTTAGSVDGGFLFQVLQAGSLVELVRLRAAANTQLELTINEDSLDLNYRFEGATNTQLFIIDGGTDSFGLGSAAFAGAFLGITGGTTSRAFDTAVGTTLHIPLDTYTDTQDTSDAIRANIFFGTPTFESSAAATYADAANVYIQGPATATGNVTITSALALWIDDGNVRVDGDFISDTTVTIAALRLRHWVCRQPGIRDLYARHGVHARCGIHPETGRARACGHILPRLQRAHPCLDQ